MGHGTSVRTARSFASARAGSRLRPSVTPAFKRPRKRPTLAEKLLGVRPAVFSDHLQLIASGVVEALDVVTDPRAHHLIAVPALESGLHVICEKPLGLTVRACRLMVDAADGSGAVLATAENYRRDSPNRLARAVLDRGLLGDLHFMTEMNVGGDDRVIVSPWRHLRESGSISLDMGVHYADIFLYLLGELDQVAGVSFIAEPFRVLAPGTPGRGGNRRGLPRRDPGDGRRLTGRALPDGSGCADPAQLRPVRPWATVDATYPARPQRLDERSSRSFRRPGRRPPRLADADGSRAPKRAWRLRARRRDGRLLRLGRDRVRPSVRGGRRRDDRHRARRLRRRSARRQSPRGRRPGRPARGGCGLGDLGVVRACRLREDRGCHRQHAVCGSGFPRCPPRPPARSRAACVDEHRRVVAVSHAALSAVRGDRP